LLLLLLPLPTLVVVLQVQQLPTADARRSRAKHSGNLVLACSRRFQQKCGALFCATSVRVTCCDASEVQ